MRSASLGRKRKGEGDGRGKTQDPTSYLFSINYKQFRTFPKPSQEERTGFLMKQLFRSGVGYRQTSISCPSPTSSANGYSYKTLPHLRLRKHCRRGSGDRGICYEIVSPSTVRKNTHKSYKHDFPKHELNKDDTNRQGKVSWGESPGRPQPCTKGGRQLRKAEGKRNGFLQRKAQSVIQYQKAGPENTHTSSSVQTEQVILRNRHDIHPIIINDKRCHDMKERKEG